MGINEFEKGKKYSFNESIAYADKSIVSKQIMKKISGYISLFAFDKGEALTQHIAIYDSTVFILEGKAEITIAENSNILNAGETIVIPGNIRHSLKAIEKFKMVRIMIKSRF